MSGFKPDAYTAEQGTESLDGSQTGELSKPQSPAISKRQKVKRHCARWWWLHLIIFAAIALIVVLPVVYVGYPHIAQHDVNRSTIINTAQIVMDPSGERLNLTLKGTLETTSTFHPTLDSFNASLYLENNDYPFVNVTVPAIHAKNGTQFEVSQFVEVADLAALTQYAESLLAFKTFNVWLRGSGGLKLGSLPTTTVHYNQSIQVLGLNALQGVEVTELTLAANQSFNGNAYGTAMIPNPSVSTLQLGDVSLTLEVNGTSIGNATLADLILTPGNNSYPLFATVNQLEVAALLNKPQYQCGVLPVTLKGNASVYNGEVVPYFTSALELASLSTMLNVTTTLEKAGFASLIKGACQ